jgi:hypothetical protein
MNEPTKSDIDEIKVNTQKLTETVSDFVVQYEVDMTARYPNCGA